MILGLSAAAFAIPICAPGVGEPCAADFEEALDLQPTGVVEIELAVGTYAMSLDTRGRDVSITRLDPDELYDVVLITGDGIRPVFTVTGGSLTFPDNSTGADAWRPDLSSRFVIAPSHGRAIEAVDATLELHEVTLLGSGEPQTSGGVILAEASPLSLYRSVVTNGVAQTTGGLIASDGDVELADCDLTDGRAGTNGGLVYGDRVVIRGWQSINYFDAGLWRGAASQWGSAVYATTSVELSRVTLIAGPGVSAISSYDVVAANLDLWMPDANVDNLYGLTGVNVDVEDSRFRTPENAIYADRTLQLSQSTVCGGTPAFAPDADIVITNNLFLDIQLWIAITTTGRVRHNTVIGGQLDSLVHLYRRADSDGSDIGSNILSDVSFDPADQLSAGDHNLWWPRVPSNQQDGTQIAGDPELPALSAEDPCPLWSEIALAPRWWGAGRDAGPDVDPDGTPADLGAYGGVDFDLGGRSAWSDADGDGVPALYDCASDDPARSPTAFDPPYDGVDQDCRADDDFDADRDGERPIAWGGPDCDDNNAQRTSIGPEIDGNGLDDDCDGWADVGPLVPRAACAPGGGAGWTAPLLGAAFALSRRGRASRSRSGQRRGPALRPR